MGLLALLLLALAGWLILTGRLQRMTMTDGLMLGLAIVGAILAARGQGLFGGGALTLAGLHGWRRLTAKRKPPAATPAPAARALSPAEQLEEARALLGLDEDADEEAIRAAHRRLIAKNHPDVGGTRALAEKINDARRILLRHAQDMAARDTIKPSSPPSDSPQNPTGPA